MKHLRFAGGIMVIFGILGSIITVPILLLVWTTSISVYLGIICCLCFLFFLAAFVSWVNSHKALNMISKLLGEE